MNREHVHTYDALGRITCCSEVENGPEINPVSHAHEPHAHPHRQEHNHDHGEASLLHMFAPAAVSLILLLGGLAIDSFWTPAWFYGWIKMVWYLLAYLPVGLPVLREAWKSLRRGIVFSEFLLMILATAGAFFIKEYPEGVAVMLFYAVGEGFQTLAVQKAKRSIRTMLARSPDQVTVLRNNLPETVKAETVVPGEIVRLKPGEKSGLDGVLLSEKALFDTAALTGESLPEIKIRGDAVPAGLINLHTGADIQVTAAYADSRLNKIIEMVQEVAARKAPTERFIRKFAGIYTPVVVGLALGICTLPALFVEQYIFSDWLYRALIFLVISCPCALVISIPLSYFGGIGAAGKHGILVKGGQYLDVLAAARYMVLDKTGTLTEGRFQVQELQMQLGFNRDELLAATGALESRSSHPVAVAITRYTGGLAQTIQPDEVEEFPGMGMRGVFSGKELLVGNLNLLKKFSIPCDAESMEGEDTQILLAFEGRFAGVIHLADALKPGAASFVKELEKLKLTPIMLSGDRESVVKRVAEQLGIPHAFGGLMPEQKAEIVTQLKTEGGAVIFAGDGLNDAPVLAVSDAGIAMGGGSDFAIESSDLVIQDVDPQKIALAVRIARKTQKVVWQNIGLAFGVKLLVLLLGAGGVATMWEAVFADVGVSLLAIWNAVRVQRKS